MLIMSPDPFAAWQIRDFRFYIVGRLFFIIGLRMSLTVVSWWLYEVTHDPLAIGLIGLSEVIPAVGLALYAGHVIDTTERAGLLRKTMSVYALTFLLIFLVSTSLVQKHFSQHSWIFMVYLLMAVTGGIRAFTGSLYPAILAQTVSADMLKNAVTLNSGVFLIAAIIGHSMGGFLIAVIGVQGALMVCFILVVLSYLIIRKIGPKPVTKTNLAQSAWTSVQEGLRFVFNTKELLAAMTLDLFAVLFGGATAMVPAFSKDILHVGPTGFGWLTAASDIGSMLTIIGMTLRPIKSRQGIRLLYVVAGFGISIIVFALSKNYILSFIALMMSGMFDGVSTVVRGTISQIFTPHEIKGRVLSVNSIFINSSNELGQFESGFAAKLLGLVPSVVFGGSMTLIVVLLTWWKSPKLKKLEY